MAIEVVGGGQKKNAEKCAGPRWVSKKGQINLYATTHSRRAASTYSPDTPTSISPHKALREQNGPAFKKIFYIDLYISLKNCIA